ncbi:hypothetical protein EG68_06491 [Paragonimus skrjabini miyazakii]|uniref:Breast carcinoma amplified sequence 3 n=1 Tax=Paragonimus skrjabini miyazakii TaxID=59628 RepID=A0A8S9YAE6_9TREM|nr:hypothetical protein EG68_06491 [Paragonimus skrjabini miyazakii]
MRPFLTVLPEKYSEKNLVSSVMGVINDYVPLSHHRSSDLDEQVFWTKFENCDVTRKSLPSNFAYPLVLSIGTCKKFYLWGFAHTGKAVLLFSERNTCTINSKLLPSPLSDEDDFSGTRPLIALCDVIKSCFQWHMRFVSLADYKTVRTLYFESKTLSVDATSRFVIVARTDCITVLSATTLLECFTITGVKPNASMNSFPKSVPFSLGDRWLAFPDVKPYYHHLSRCGDASSDESRPLSSTVMNVNKRIWNSLSALANSVVPNASSGSALQPESVRLSPRIPGQPGGTVIGGPDSGWTVLTESASPTDQTTTPGYVTIVDIVALDAQFASWRRVESEVSTINFSATDTVGGSGSSGFSGANCSSSQLNPVGVLSGTSYLNVHDLCEPGSLIAHFMAHRWANVSMLKFDSTGSLLFTACTRGHRFNLFRISNHPCDQRQTAVHHLYILERGTIPCEVVDVTFSHDSRWIAVSSNHGTTHVFPITAYGGPITVRTHTRPYVVNRTSRYHRSSGLDEHHLTRPHLERGSGDLTANLTAAVLSTEGVGSTTTFAGPGPGCRGAPVAGLAPQCPHLGIITGPAAGSYGGSTGSIDVSAAHSSASSLALTHPSDPSFLPAAIEGACSCPLNALYNTSNPRLPPYPEPCQLKPEARLKPHQPGSATTGAAAAALGAATGAFGAVTTSSSNASSLGRHASMLCVTNVGGTQHPGPCMHHPCSNLSVQPVRLQNQPGWYPLPVVEHCWDTFMGPSGGPCIAAQFATPLCFLPNRPRSGTILTDQGRDPYSNKSRAVDGLFIVTADLHLVEYDLRVGPAESANYGEKLYQDGSIRLDCSPVGEWNLRTDAVYVPPFPKHHPLLAAFSTLRSFFEQRNKKDVCVVSSEVLRSSDEPDSFVHEEIDLSETNSKPNQSPVALSKPTDDVENRKSAPEKWTPEDAASYWYSQVEITTHLGPLRRIWMGPQFTFQTYSMLSDVGDSSFALSPLVGEINSSSSLFERLVRIETIKSTDLNKLLPPCNETTTLTSFYGSPKHLDLDAVELHCDSPVTGLNLSTTSPSSSATILLPESGLSRGASPGRVHQKSGTPRSLAGRLLEVSGAGCVLRWRNRSGELTRPISIACPPGTCTDVADVSVFIEGGSYQDSSLGGSLSSLIGRGGDDVASCIAEAIQDEDTFWHADRNYSELGASATPVGSGGHNSGVFQFGVRVAPPVTTSPPELHPSMTTVSAATTTSPVVMRSSALSEADFPSQEVSPQQHPNPLTEWIWKPQPASDGDNAPTLVLVHTLNQQPSADPAECAKLIDVDSTSLSVDQPKVTSKKSRRSKKSRPKSRNPCSGSVGELASGYDIPCKPSQTSMTSPSISGPDSLSTSPAVVEDLRRSMLNQRLGSVAPTCSYETEDTIFGSSEDTSELWRGQHGEPPDLMIDHPADTVTESLHRSPTEDDEVGDS